MDITVFFKNDSYTEDDIASETDLTKIVNHKVKRYINQIYVLKNNKLYYKKEKITSNFKNNPDIIKTHLSKNIEGIYYGTKLEFSSDDFKIHTEEIEKINLRIKLNKMK